MGVGMGVGGGLLLVSAVGALRWGGGGGGGLLLVSAADGGGGRGALTSQCSRGSQMQGVALLCKYLLSFSSEHHPVPQVL